MLQGTGKKKNYFEGWYFKMVAHDGSAVMSVIPGIALSKDGNVRQAFIQVINGITAQTSYFVFPMEEFSHSPKEFSLTIGNNYFSKDRIILDLKDDTSTVTGTVEMHNLVEYDSGSWFNPGIMGWYRYVPFMECYHGVVSLTHDLSGRLSVDNQEVDFTGGKGYIEKDWGSSMPSAWIWMQSNSFASTDSSFMLSVATIPWLGSSFNGYLGFLYHNKRTYHFATYRSTKLQLEITESDVIKISIKNPDHTILVEAKSNKTGLLQAPAQGSMERRIPESINATLKLSLLDEQGKLVFTDSTDITGLEMVGDFRKLQLSQM